MLVLNATYEPINVCTLRRAAVLLLKEKAELLERRQGALHSERMTIEQIGRASCRERVSFLV